MSGFFRRMESQQDRDFVRRLYEDHCQELISAAMRVLNDQQQAEEAVQKAFCKVMRCLQSFYNLSANDSTALLVTIVKRTAIDEYRKNRIRNDEEMPLEDYYESWEKSVEDQAERAVLGDRMRRALGEISDIYADTLMLYYYYGFKHAEIARMLGTSAGASRWRVCEGKKLIGQILREEEWVDEGKPDKSKSKNS